MNKKPPDEKNQNTETPRTELPPEGTPTGPQDILPPEVPQIQAQPPAPEKTVTIPSKAMKALKQEQVELGKKQAAEALDAHAQSLGFEDHESLVQAALNSKKQPPATPPKVETPPGQQAPDALQTRLAEAEANVQKLTEEKRRLSRTATQEEKKRVKLEQELLAKEAETQLRIEAMRAGVKDVDYAINLLRRNMASLSAEDLEAFDEKKYFGTELRKSHPYLYEVEQQPANTGPTEQQTPPPASPSKTTQETVQNGSIDATKLSREEYDKLLRSKGLMHPSTGSTTVF